MLEMTWKEMENKAQGKEEDKKRRRAWSGGVDAARKNESRSL